MWNLPTGSSIGKPGLLGLIILLQYKDSTRNQIIHNSRKSLSFIPRTKALVL